jgi:glyoxylase-like metal-dependent hydrolase (beta-lactamase superfamily II)
MHIENAVVTDFETNCYLVGCEETKDAMIIDPGGDFDAIKKMIDDSGYNIKYIVCTHGHNDHILAVKKLKDYTNALVMIHDRDKKALQNSLYSGAVMFGREQEECGEDRVLFDGDKFDVGNIAFTVIHTPGHTKGGICLYTPGHLFSGDTLFFATVGRTDFPLSSFEEISSSVLNKLYKLPDDTIVYPGHGRRTTIGFEKKNNCFIRI